jgi:hypothetical protein
MKTVQGALSATRQESPIKEKDNVPSVTTAVLIQDSAIGINELKFELENVEGPVRSKCGGEIPCCSGRKHPTDECARSLAK